MPKDNRSVLVIFEKDFPRRGLNWWKQFNVIVAEKTWQSKIEGYGLTFINIEDLIEPGSIYEASAFAEELSHLKLSDGSHLSKLFIYKGYELWWINYNTLFLYFCLPYTQYKKLLEYLKGFQSVYLYQPPFKSLFSYYLQAYGCNHNIIQKQGVKSLSFLPFGILIQIFITLISLPFLMVRKYHLMIFIGDKFEKSKDYDFRMKFIYQELRGRNITFVEFIRSLESWKKVLAHALVRKRPVIYSEGIAFVGRFLSVVTGGYSLAKRKFDSRIFAPERDPETRFKLLVATHYLQRVYDDMWSIRIMKLILRIMGVKVGLFTAATERSFHTVIGCKLLGIPTVGILHGVASRYYNQYDFLPGFDGKKMLSVDKYGLWSNWWKEYYLKNSKAYRPEQLYVSGPMRPLEKSSGNISNKTTRKQGSIKVLFISEQLATPHEVIPYIETLLQQSNIEIAFSFRHHRDGFKEWLLDNMPQLLQHPNIKITRGNLPDSIKSCDVAIGCHSTAVLETLLQLKVPIFFNTQKWGDYYSLKEYDEKHSFFAENPKELVEKIKKAQSISEGILKDLQEKYFGDPYKNGSKWVVEQVEKILRQTP